MKKYYLVDGEEIFNSEYMHDFELAHKQQEAKDLSKGQLYWTDNEANMRYSEMYRHISREDIALNKQGK